MARPVHLLHDSRTLARMIGAETPCCEQVAISTEGPMKVFASFVDGNPLSGAWLVDLDAPSPRIVTWSGTLADEPFGDDPRTWMRAGHERFARFLDEVAPALRTHGRTLCFRPHHRHVLGDVHASVKLLRDRAGEPFEVLLSPSDLLAPSMLDTAEDHLARMFAHLGPVAAAVLLEDARIGARSEETGLLEPCAAGEGALPLPLLRRLLAEHVPPATPVILPPDAQAPLRAALEL
jgi:sugar phosphate isomerase/epimerase